MAQMMTHGESLASAGAVVIRNGRNLGKGLALRRGIRKALQFIPTIIVTLDGDGQHDPADIAKIVEPIQDGEADIVLGSRFSGTLLSEIPLARGLGLSFIDRINRSLMRSNIRDSQSGFRAYSAPVINLVMSYTSTGFGVETEQLAVAEFGGYRIAEVPIQIKYKGLQKTSKEHPFLHGATIISTIVRIAVERRPLLFFGLPGTLFILGSLFIGSDLVTLFNNSRYFSLPLAMITMGLMIIGSLLLLASFVFYALKRVREDQISRAVSGLE